MSGRAALAVLGVLAAVCAGCGAGGGPSPSPPLPGSPLDQPVPQTESARTFCLDPPGSGLRAFTDGSGHRRMVTAVVVVAGLPEGNPWRCP